MCTQRRICCTIWHLCRRATFICLQERFARKNEAADLRRAFDTLDKNHDGHIDANELNALFLALGHKTKKVGSGQLKQPQRNPCSMLSCLGPGVRPLLSRTW